MTQICGCRQAFDFSDYSGTSEYFETLRGRSIAVIGMGVSNTPLIRMLLRAELRVTVCDKSPRERVEEQASELESLGAKLKMGPDYLSKIHKFDVIEWSANPLHFPADGQQRSGEGYGE